MQEPHALPCNHQPSLPVDQSKPSPPAPPPNFSWCVEDVLCACAYPGELQHLHYLMENNVTCLVSLTAERQVTEEFRIDEVKLRVVHVPIRDYTPPTFEQVEQFIQCVLDTSSKKQATCVHCAHGLGRTGTMLACYFVQVNDMTAEEAIAHVRELRFGSIETTEQELLVFEFYNHWQAKKAAKAEQH